MPIFNPCATKTTQVSSIRNCMDTLQQMTSSFNSSAKSVTQLQAEIVEEGPNEDNQQMRLKSLCETTFLERHESVLTVLSSLPYVIGSVTK